MSKLLEAKKTFAANVVEALKKGTAKWIRPWDINEVTEGMPRNATTGKAYSGWNAFNLMFASDEDCRFMTFNQAKSKGWKIKKGSKGFTIFRPVGKKVTVVNEETGEKEDRIVFLTNFIPHTVFNATQVEGMPEVDIPRNEWDVVALGERILKNSGAKIEFGGNRAFYSPSEDYIKLPKKEQFKSAAGFYGTALHELCHWTGHETRLNRPQRNSFGSVEYGWEELYAELATFMLCAETGLPYDPSEHLSYIDFWRKKIEDDYQVIFDAIAKAEKIKNYVMEFAK